MFGLGWLGVVIFIVAAIITCPIWLAILGWLVEVVIAIIAGIFEAIACIAEEFVECWHVNPKTTSTVLGVGVLLVILGLAYFFSA